MKVGARFSSLITAYFPTSSNQPYNQICLDCQGLFRISFSSSVAIFHQVSGLCTFCPQNLTWQIFAVSYCHSFADDMYQP